MDIFDNHERGCVFRDHVCVDLRPMGHELIEAQIGAPLDAHECFEHFEC